MKSDGEYNIALVQDTYYMILSVLVDNIENSEDTYGRKIDYQHISGYPTNFSIK